MKSENTVGARVAVVGSGYVGTVVGSCLAALGRQVVGVETDGRKLAMLQGGQLPFYEPGLEPLLGAGLAEGRLRFTSDIVDVMTACDVVFLCVGTPPNGDGKPDMGAFVGAARDIGASLRRHHDLVIKSTVPIGSGHWMMSILEDTLPTELAETAGFSVVSCPEFLREGCAVTDFLHPDRLVFGSSDQRAIDRVTEVYRPILDQSFAGGDPFRRPTLVRTTLETAEMVKYASNAFLATKISFINEIANICELTGADVADVARVIGLDPRIGPDYLAAGIGWGGSCFGKDLSALVTAAAEYRYRPHLLEATIAVNKRQRRWVVDKLRNHLKTLPGKRVAILGLAFKAGTDDLRDAPALDVATWLLASGASVSGYDPLVRTVPGVPGLRLADNVYAAAARADALVVLTVWPEYRALDLVALREGMRGNLIVDGRNLLDPAAVTRAGFVYKGVGRVVPSDDLLGCGHTEVLSHNGNGVRSRLNEVRVVRLPHDNGQVNGHDPGAGRHADAVPLADRGGLS